jgi:hypothetical protein
MSVFLGTLLTLSGFVGLLILAVLRALALDEVRGRIARRAERSVEETLASMSVEQQAEWADEWRAELAAVRSMPVSALRFARGVRASADEMVGAQALAGATGRRTVSLARGTERLRSAAGRVGTSWRSENGKRIARLLRYVPAVIALATTALSIQSGPARLPVALALSSITLVITLYEILSRR